MTPSDPPVSQTRRTRLIVAGVLLVVALTALVKTLAADWLSARLTAPEIQLAESREEGMPALVFFHSPDCLSCLEVKKNLDAVHPAYAQKVRLIDVDVTRKNGRSLVERLGLMTTPSLLFVSAAGEEELFVGEISQVELTSRLDLLSGETP